jgi:hypothetical protein
MPYTLYLKRLAAFLRKERKQQLKKLRQSLKRRYSSRTFRYGYLVTT